MSRATFVVWLFGGCLCLGCSGGELPPPVWADKPPPAVGAAPSTAVQAATPIAKPEVILSPAEQKLFAWLDTLGFPDLAQRQFVQVKPQDLARPLAFDRLPRGFLLSENEQTFTVFTLDLERITFQTAAAPRARTPSAGYQTLDLVQEVRTVLTRMSRPDYDRRQGRFYRKTSDRAEAVLLARACLANGLGNVVHELVDQAAALRGEQTGKPSGVDGLQLALTEDLGTTVIWLNTLALGDPAVSRAELLERFRSFSQKFAGTRHAPQADETAKILERMVKEDVEHEQRKKPLSEMTMDERVAELIYQLRDQNGRQWKQPGGCEIFLDPRDDQGLFMEIENVAEGSGSPATQLLWIGFEAVPQLIEHLEDDTLTRSVGYGRDFRFSHEALRVRDCARAILHRISALPYDGYFTPYKVETWWKEFQKKGEKQSLIEGVTAVTQNSTAQAWRLMKKHPDAALAAMITGAKKTDKPWIRTGFVELASQIPGDQSTAFLLSELQAGPDLRIRTSAAKALVLRKHPDAIPALIREWEQLTEDPERAAKGHIPDGSRQLINVMLNSENAAARQALEQGLEQRSKGLQQEVTQALQARRLRTPTGKPQP